MRYLLLLRKTQQFNRSAHKLYLPGQYPIRLFSSSSSSAGPVTAKLQELISQGTIHHDDHQSRAAQELDRLHQDLLNQAPPKDIPAAKAERATKSSSSSFFGGFFSSGNNTDDDDASSSTSTSTTTTMNNPMITGAYMYGGVGCGKTFLMNLLYDSIDDSANHPWNAQKQKVHYHKFMLDVHQHMHEARKKDPQGDLIQPVVVSVLEKGRLLCLDEFQVTDVADALILQRLFEGLWNAGCVVVATSNRPPKDLYLNGLQRDRFLPFIDLLEKNCNVIDLLDSETDYRQVIASQDNNKETTLQDGNMPVYYHKGQHLAYRELYHALAGDHPSNPTQLETQGRKVKIPLACPKRHLAKFSFEDLCCKALGAADYLVIGSQFNTVFCHDIPKLTIHHVNWLRRFITFVDTMYELKVNLVLHTHAPSMDDIFKVDNKQEFSQDEVFAFDRTKSRLEEMSSKQYLKSPWQGDSDDSSSSSKRQLLDIPIQSGEDYGGQLARPALPTLRATPMSVNQID